MLQFFCQRLLESGQVNRADLESAINNKRRNGGSLALNLVLAGILDDDTLASIYAEFLGLPRAVEAELDLVTRSMFELMPIEIIYDTGILPLGRIVDDRLKVGVVDPSEPERLEEAEFFSGAVLDPRIITVTQMALVFERITGRPWKVPMSKLRRRMQWIRRTRSEREASDLHVLVHEMTQNEGSIERAVTEPGFDTIEVLPATEGPTITLRAKEAASAPIPLVRRRDETEPIQLTRRAQPRSDALVAEPWQLARTQELEAVTAAPHTPAGGAPAVPAPRASTKAPPKVPKKPPAPALSDRDIRRIMGASAASGSATLQPAKEMPVEEQPSIMISESLTGFAVPAAVRDAPSPPARPQAMHTPTPPPPVPTAEDSEGAHEVFAASTGFEAYLGGDDDEVELSMHELEWIDDDASETRGDTSEADSDDHHELDLDDLEIVEEDPNELSGVPEVARLRLDVGPTLGARRSALPTGTLGEGTSAALAGVGAVMHTPPPTGRFGDLKTLRAFLGEASAATKAAFRNADLAIEAARERDAVARAVVDALAAIYPGIVVFSIRHPSLVVWQLAIRRAVTDRFVGTSIDVDGDTNWQRVRAGESYLGPISADDPVRQALPGLVGEDVLLVPIALGGRSVAILMLDGGRHHLTSPGRFLGVLQSGIADALRRVILLRKRSIEII